MSVRSKSSGSTDPASDPTATGSVRIASSPRVLVVLTMAVFALGACGGDDDGGGESAKPQGGDSDRAAVERAARAYVVEQQADEDDPEEASRLSMQSIEVNGDQAEAKVRSSATGNLYEATLAKQGGSWEGLTLLTDRPSEPGGGGGDPAAGSGRKIATDELEQNLEKTLVTRLVPGGEVSCPPEIRLRRGNNFSCKVSNRRRRATIKVTQKDDRGNLNYEITTRR